MPGAPAITNVTVGDRQLTAKWTAPPTGGRPITGYTLEVRAGSTVVTTKTTTGTTLTVTGLTPGASYTVTVAAVNALGVGPASPAKTATLPDVPGAPTITSLDGQSGSFFEVIWPASATGDAATSYTVGSGTVPPWSPPRPPPTPEPGSLASRRGPRTRSV